MLPESPSAKLAPVHLRAIASKHAPPDSAPPVAMGDFPRPLTSLIGREAEVAAASTLLLEGRTCLLTLTGPGGVGKTRLAVRIGEAAAAAFPDGVVFVPLAAIDDPALVLPAIAQALGLREADPQPLADRIADYLRPRHLLLVLDNFEQVRPAATHLATLLANCRGLIALITSRVPLHVAGEQRFPVVPLALSAPTTCPSASEDPSLVMIAASPAMQLFVARAQAVDPSFAITVENAASIAAICRLLDGLPLAIELAAARICLLSPSELLARLDPVLPLLSGGPADAPDRLRTMRQAIAWSYDLLLPAEQTLFRRLAVFVGGFTLEAAEDVGAFNAEGGASLRGERGGGEEEENERRSSLLLSPLGRRSGRLPLSEAPHVERSGPSLSSVIDLVASLVDTSLLRRTEEGGAARFGMLETIREFGLEQLAASGEEATARDAHAAYYLDLAERVEPDLFGGRDLVPVLCALEAEHANLRAALDHLLGAGDAVAALRLAGALAPFWLFHSHRSEGRHWLARALAVTGHRAPRFSPDERDGVEASRARALGGAATLAFTQGDQEGAAELARENLALRRRLGETRGFATALNLLGAVERARGAYDEAARCCEEAVTLFQKLGEPGWLALARCNLGILAYRRGDLDQAAALLEAAVAFYREAGDRYAYGAAVALSDLGLVTCDRGDQPRAAALFTESLTRWRAVGTKEGLADWLARVATLAVADGHPRQASGLFGAAEALREAIGYAFEAPERERHERAMAAARAVIGDTMFAAAWAAGGALSLDEAIAEATELAHQMTTSSSGWPAIPTVSAGTAGLTAREHEVLRLLVDGWSDKEIAAVLGIGRRTASSHVATIRAKLDAPSRAAAVAVAVRDRLV